MVKEQGVQILRIPHNSRGAKRGGDLRINAAPDIAG